MLRLCAMGDARWTCQTGGLGNILGESSYHSHPEVTVGIFGTTYPIPTLAVVVSSQSSKLHQPTSRALFISCWSS